MPKGVQGGFLGRRLEVELGAGCECAQWVGANSLSCALKCIFSVSCCSCSQKHSLEINFSLRSQAHLPSTAQFTPGLLAVGAAGGRWGSTRGARLLLLASQQVREKMGAPAEDWKAAEAFMSRLPLGPMGFAASGDPGTL